jgi:hypothetical protein
MGHVVSQLDLPMPVALIDDDVVARQPSLTRAIVVCADIAGFEDKRAAAAAGVDPATWSKIKSGLANFPQENWRKYQAKCGNWLPLQWQARDAGFGLVALETELERQLRTEREAKAHLQAENALLKGLLVGRAS